MMDFLAALFVARPLNILMVAAVFLSAYVALRMWASADVKRYRSMLIASGAWCLYAAWEWLVLVKTPEADIRVDLLIVWPVMALLSAWALFRLLR